ncbi:MAG: 30S ribosomal protein S20 [Candidatus Humimicrobiaceae bacterium]
MPNIQSQIKRDRQNKKRFTANKTLKTRIKSINKRFLQSVEQKDTEAAEKNLNLLFKALDKAAKNNVVHKNFVANKKSKAHKKLGTIKS